MTAAEYAEKAGKNLRQIMYDKQVTQAQLSHDLKISKGTVNSWVNGKRLPRAESMDKICRYLQCTREDILDGPKEPISKKTISAGPSPADKRETLRESFGKNLSNIMHEMHITQEMMADELKLQKATIFSWMNGEQIPQVTKIQKLCNYLNCSQADLFNIEKLCNTLPENTGAKTEISNISPEAIKIAEQIDKDENLRLLVNAASGSPPEDIKLAIDVIWGLKHARQANNP